MKMVLVLDTISRSLGICPPCQHGQFVKDSRASGRIRNWTASPGRPDSGCGTCFWARENVPDNKGYFKYLDRSTEAVSVTLSLAARYSVAYRYLEYPGSMIVTSEISAFKKAAVQSLLVVWRLPPTYSITLEPKTASVSYCWMVVQSISWGLKAIEVSLKSISTMSLLAWENFTVCGNSYKSSRFTLSCWSAPLAFGLGSLAPPFVKACLVNERSIELDFSVIFPTTIIILAYGKSGLVCRLPVVTVPQSIPTGMAQIIHTIDASEERIQIDALMTIAAYLAIGQLRSRTSDVGSRYRYLNRRTSRPLGYNGPQNRLRRKNTPVPRVCIERIQSQSHGYHKIADAIPCEKLLHRSSRPILDPMTYLHAFGELAAAAEYFPK